MSQGEITVRRAKPGDAASIAAFINQAWQGRSRVDRQAILGRLGVVGFLLAERDGRIVGMLGWRIENLVVRVSDFLVWPASELRPASMALFVEMERIAASLQSEVALLFPPRPTPPALVEFFKTMGYVPQVVVKLDKVWREAARESGFDDNDVLLMKQLRKDRVMRPV